MGQIIELLKSINYQISQSLLFNYKSMNITDQELIILIYLINQKENIYNPKQISSDLKIELNTVFEEINSLCEKGIIKIEMKRINKVLNETINLDLLYEKLAFSLNQVEEKEDTNLYSIFETEFGRTLSPMEYEIINSWKDSGYTEELIILALKEATYNGVSNLRYIDKIIYEWGKKGIKTKEDVEKNRKQFKEKEKPKKVDVFDYDWMEDSNEY